MLYPVITKRELRELYLERNLSMMQISKQLGCSHHKVAYWMSEYKIKRRSRSQAVYLINNPLGDPFKIKEPRTKHEAILYGLGIGLYWGEGNRASLNLVRLGNSDPALLKCYTQFLTELCGVKKGSLKFSLQIFSDIDVDTALNFWVKELNVSKEQFFKPRVTISGSIGTYKRKSEYGVVTIYFGNTKLHNIITGQIAEAASLFGKTGRRSLVVKHTHGKRESTSSILVVGSINEKD